MLYIFGGLALSITYTAVALVLATQSSHLPWFGDIRIACRVMFTPLDECQSAAVSAGLTTLWGLLIGTSIMIALFLIYRRSYPGMKHRWVLPPLALNNSLVYRLFLAATSLILLSHFLFRLTSPLQVERLAILSQERSFASLENLCWPILLQLYVAERSRVGRYLSLSLLLVMASLTFFRAMQLAILIFGVTIFLLEAASYALRKRRHWRLLIPVVSERLLVGILLTILFLSAVKSDTSSRDTMIATQDTSEETAEDSRTSASKNALSGNVAVEFSESKTLLRDEKNPPASVTTLRIAQRIIFPLYQASLAENIGKTLQLPGPVDDISRKLRISNSPNLNEFLYRALYGYHPVGQTTSLLYGEASAWSSAPPIMWIIAVVLFFGILTIGAYRLFIPAGLLIGLSIWRGYNGGFVDIIPSLSIQLVIIAAIAKTAYARK